MGEELLLDAKRIDYGHDLAQLRRNLALSPQERIEQGVARSNFILRSQ